MTQFQLLKMRGYFAWRVLTGKYEPAAITPLPNAQNAKDECLKLALEALEALGKRPRGGSVSARSAHRFIATQLAAQGVVL